MQLTEHLYSQIAEQHKKKPERITVVGIDGPTASGKTILADNLRDKLVQEGLECWVFRLDWTLIERSTRVADLENLKKDKFGFEFEAEQHMNLSVVENFLLDVAKYNQRNIDGAQYSENLTLEKLYSREHDGKLEGREKVTLKPGMVVILEGHYTLRCNLDKHIDLNILLLGTMAEFLQRKIDRIKGYRSADDAIDYYWRIDIPSFKNHLDRFGFNVDVVVDNTDYKNPKIENKKYIVNWLNQENSSIYPKQQLSSDIASFVFSNSISISSELREHLAQTFATLQQWDLKVGSHLRTEIASLDADLTDIINGFVADLNEKNKSSDYSFKVMHTDALSNVYHRIIPISLSLGLFYKDKREAEVVVLAEAFQQELSLQIIWDGGYKKISLERELGKIAKGVTTILKDSTETLLKASDEADEIEIMLPTDFTIPKFVDDFNCKLIFIKKENEVISASQALCRIIERGGVWIHRFALFSELRFFQNILNKIGAHAVQVGNYLISMRHDNQELRTKFLDFAGQWSLPLHKKELFLKSQDEMDGLIHNERKIAKEFVQKECKHFIMMDGYLFSKFMYESDDKIQESLAELKLMMLSEIRLLRKRANQFLLRYFPMLTLKTKTLWQDLPAQAREGLSLDGYNKINPSIMAEVYLWLAIRGERSSVLATNIYDIRNNSYDSLAYLDCSADSGFPVVLQSSLNAIGQEDTAEDGSKIEGYLKVPNGPEDFINVVMKAARDLYLTKGKLPPLFGIGLDHVAVDYDKPKGRSKKFLEKSCKTGKITHYVEDGASLFDAKSRDRESLVDSYNKMVEYSVNLPENLSSVYLIDREICAGELNYVEDSQQALIPTADEMRLFMDCYQKALEKRGHLALLSRPMLFIGNLGTTHHSYDRTPPQVEHAKVWRDALKSENFISPVLHGTSGTHRDVLANAAHGCHKINVAGDFAHEIVDNLPEKISRIIVDSGLEAKRMFASVRTLMDELTDDEKQHLHDALASCCKNIQETIDSPKLTSMDSNYFHYNTYSYPAEHVDVILNSLSELIGGYKDSEAKHKKQQYDFSASMIEVPENDMFEIVGNLWNKGIRNFHVDVGDGKFITRKFSGLEKAKFLKQNYPEAKIHTHLMVEEPHLSHDGNLCVIQQYVNAGCDAIAIHPRAFKNDDELIDSLKLIRNLGSKPGIVIETHDSFNSRLKNIVEQAELDWLLVMGVPIGYGGQMFQLTTLQLINNINEYFKANNKDALIEVDGGLNFQTLTLCKNAGAELFAGWSIIKATEPEILSEKIDQVNQILAA